VRPAVVLVAKAPVAGSVKTRIAADVGAEAAAHLAAAAFTDTLDAVESWAEPARRLAFLSGDLGAAVRGGEIAGRLGSGWQVARQPDAPFATRLVEAFLTAERLWGTAPCVLVGMDSPQLTITDLDRLFDRLFDRVGRRASRRPTACVGPAEDGGWWGLAISDPSAALVIESVPMSTPQTFERTVGALRTAGLAVHRGPCLRDMDTLADARAIAADAPHLRIAGELRPALIGSRR
jgi:glycosyltransferase A (GT-A) superfamily protein (DUF2064 family)